MLASEIREFLEEIVSKEHFSRHTFKNYDHYLKRFWEFAKDIPPQGIDEKLINRYKKYLSGISDSKGFALKKSTQNYHLIALRAFLQHLQQKGIVDLPINLVKLESQEKKEITVLDMIQVREIIEAPDTSGKQGIRDRTILEVLSCSGLLVSEIVSLGVNQIDFETQKINQVKGRDIPLSNQAITWLKTYLLSRKDTLEPLFLLTERSIERIVKKYAKKVGLHATPQILRHSFATHLLASGLDVSHLKQALGHKNIVTTKGYLKQFFNHE